MNEQTIMISGMTCGACIKLVTKILTRMDGITSVLSVTAGMAKVSVSTKQTKEAYTEALEGTPYVVTNVI